MGHVGRPSKGVRPRVSAPLRPELYELISECSNRNGGKDVLSRGDIAAYAIAQVFNRPDLAPPDRDWTTFDATVPPDVVQRQMPMAG